MPPIFSFQQGSETAPARFNADASPLLGRFRAVPRPENPGPRRSRSNSRLGLLSAGFRGSVHVGYGSLLADGLVDGESDDEDDGDEDGGAGNGVDSSESDAYAEKSRLARLAGFCRRRARRMRYTWVNPRASAVMAVVDRWWSRWTVLVVFPALLAVGWCSIPFPQYALAGSIGSGWAAPRGLVLSERDGEHKAPGHGEARVLVNFWFFLLVYYGFYSITALTWITKVFHLYNLNWWPQSLGFPATISAIAVLSVAAPIPVYLAPATSFLLVHNTVWITWNFVIMATPVAVAFCILMAHERHLGLRKSLSDTQRIFTSSWWTGEPDDRAAVLSRRDARRRGGGGAGASSWEPADIGSLEVALETDARARSYPSAPVGMRRSWLPASFVRFVWFCLALLISLLVYVIGEAYAEMYLRTLPHDNFETIVYVYGWVVTVYLLDALTGWILGGKEGERVGSYPLGWVFKLYFMLTYQTYVRALYARLRSPSQFILLQLLSSARLIILTPCLMSAPFHWLIAAIGINRQSYAAYQKTAVRNVFIRFLAENASMLAFLGSVVVLHFGANKNVYPYFAFDDDEPPGAGAGDSDDVYTFGLTFYASSITWACELAASFIVAGLIRCIFGVDVVAEGKLDLVAWPELLPTSLAVMLHVLQNMLFSIVRLQFR